jgi:hypothetical protein
VDADEIQWRKGVRVYIITVGVDLLVLTVAAGLIARTVIRRRRHPEPPPTPEALEEMRKEHAHDKFEPNGGWNNVWF